MTIYRQKATVSELRKRVVNIKDASKARIALFALIELTFNNEISVDVLDKALYIAEHS